MATEDELLARPGCMRALWWSICHQCGRRINAGDVVLLADRDGHRWWLCRTCGENG